MSAHLEDFLKSGKKILGDTKTPALPKKKVDKVSDVNKLTPTDSDPHKVLVRRVIQEKPKKKELIEDFEKFIKAAEADC